MHGHNNSNNIIGFAIGAISGFWKYLASINMDLIGRMAEAGATALVCGFLGMAGKEALVATVKYLKKKFTHKNNNDGNTN